MPNVLALGTAKKAAASKVRIPCDFGNLALLQQGYTIASYDVTCSGTGAPTVSNPAVDYTYNGSAYQISALFDGGTAGTYDVVYSIVLTDADASEYEATGSLIVE